MKLTVVVMLVRAVGVAPLWKESGALCIMGFRALARVDFKVGGGSVVGYSAECLLRARGVYFRGVGAGRSLAVVDLVLKAGCRGK